MLELMKSIWRGWKGLTHGLIKGQSWLLMAIAYWIAVFPIAVFFKLFRPDPTDRGLGDPEAKSFWLPPRMGSEDIRRAQRPY